MKTSLIIRKGNTLALLIISLAFSATMAQTERTKTISKEWTLSPDATIEVEHRRGPLKITRSSDRVAKMQAIVRVKGRDEAALDKILEMIEVEDIATSSLLKLTTNSAIREISVNNVRTRIEFENGERLQLSGNVEFEVEMNLAVPANRKLIVANKYEDIILEEMDGDIDVSLYSGDLVGNDIGGELQLDLKYGSARVGQTGKAILVLYDSKLEARQLGEVNLNSKYSDVELGNAGNVTIVSYDDDIELGQIDGDLNIEAKYSEFVFQDFQDAGFDLYDSEIRGQNGGNVELKSKYSTIHLEQIGNLQFPSSYDDDVTIKGLRAFTTDAKYTEFDFENVSDKVEMVSYDGKLDIQEIGNNFSELNLNCKYDDVTLRIPSTFGFSLDSEMRYGSISLPSVEFEIQTDIQKSSVRTLKGKTSGGSSQAKFYIRAYDSKVKFN